MDSIADIKKDIETVTFDYIWTCGSYCLKGEDIDEIGKRMPILKDARFQWEKGMLIESDCISFALILGEYATAERIIDASFSVSNAIRPWTRLTDAAGNTENTPFASVFYSKDIDIPEELRIKILKRLNEDLFSGPVSNGGLIDINGIRELDKRVVQAKIVNDYHRAPECFDQRDWPRMVEEIPAACFLMKLYKNDPVNLEMLMKERLEILSEGYKVRIDRDVRGDFLKLKKAFGYSWMKEYTDCLYAMLINMYTGVKKVLNEDISCYLELDELVHEWKSIKAGLAGFISEVNISEYYYIRSIQKTRETGIEEALDCLASGERILGHKPELIITSALACNPETFFGFREYDADDPEEENDEVKENRERYRMMRLAWSVGSIDYWFIEDDRLAENISLFLMAHPKLLRDSFLLLTGKGLVPDRCLDNVIRRVRAARSCEYMLPILIMQKYGRIRRYE